MKHFVLIFAVSLLVFNCDKDDSPDPIIDIEFVEIGQGNRNGNGVFSEGPFIISNKNDWEIFKTKMSDPNNGSSILNFTETEIDFEKSLIIGVFDQVYSNGGIL